MQYMDYLVKFSSYDMDKFVQCKLPSCTCITCGGHEYMALCCITLMLKHDASCVKPMMTIAT